MRIIPGSGLIAEVSKCQAARCAADAPAIFVGSYSFSDETSLSIKKQGNAILVKKAIDLSKRLFAFGEVIVFQPTSISHVCPSTCERRASISRKDFKISIFVVVCGVGASVRNAPPPVSAKGINS